MFRKLLVTAAILVLAPLTSAYCFSYQYASVFGNSSPFDHNNNWSPINYPGIGNLPSPGGLDEGGELYDLEGLQVREQGDYVYIAMANSFGYSAHSTTWGTNFRQGDLFIGVNGGSKYQYAIDIRNATSGQFGFYRVNNSWNYIQQDPGSYYSNTTIRNKVGAFEIGRGATQLGNVQAYCTYAQGLETNYMSPGNGDTYVWEFCLNKALLGGDFSKLSFHTAVGCGNDLMDESYTAVPEPATMLLFGLGLAGAGLARRRMK